METNSALQPPQAAHDALLEGVRISSILKVQVRHQPPWLADPLGGVLLGVRVIHIGVAITD